MGDVNAVVVPELDSREQAALSRNVERLRETFHANERRTALYEGERAIRPSGGVIPPQYHNLGIALGWPAKAIDALTRRTQLERFTWADGDLESLGYERLERDNNLTAEFTQALTDSALHGVSFLVTTRGLPGEPEVLVHARDALSATGTWNPRSRRLDDALTVSAWDEFRKPTAMVLYLPGQTVSIERSGGGWSVDRSAHPWGVPVEPLVYRPRPSRRYGSSRLTRPMMGLHAMAVRELIRLEGHMDIYSWPEFWLLGGDMSAFQGSDGSQSAVWRVMLGRIKGLMDDPDKPESLSRADVKHFPAASPGPHLEALDTLSRAFAREANLPDTATALKGVSNPISAESYDASQYELIADAEGAARDWSVPGSRTVATALAMLGGHRGVPEAFWSVRPKWLGAKYESRAARADAGMKQLAAVPWLAETEVGLELLGLTDEQVRRALSERRRASGREVLRALLDRAPVVGQ